MARKWITARHLGWVVGLTIILSLVSGQAMATGTADTDGDGVLDGAEISAGSDPADPASTPEICDGVDNDLDGQNNEGYPDSDGDTQANCVDIDDDQDGLVDILDGCETIADDVDAESEVDDDADGEGNSCDTDDDNDGISDEEEMADGSDPANGASAPEVADGIDNDGDGQVDEGAPDSDQDGQIDFVDVDDDNDSVPDSGDDCPLAANADQADADGDGTGDACDCAASDPAISANALDNPNDGIDQDCDGREPEETVSEALTGDQRYPTVAYEPTSDKYVVLWQDKRGGKFDDIYGIFLDRNGNKVGFDFPVNTSSGHQQRPLVYAGGGGFLAIWQDLRDYTTNGADLYGAWVAADGTVGPEMVICSCPTDQWNPVIGYDKMTNSFLVVWVDGRGTGSGVQAYDLWGAVIPAGGATSVTPFAMVTEAGAQRGAQLGYDYENHNYYMAWNDRRNLVDYDIYGSRVAADGTLLDGTGILLGAAPGNQFRPTVTDRRPANGVNNHLIAWNDYRPGAQADVYAIFVDGTGAMAGTEFLLSNNATDEYNVRAALNWVGTPQIVVGFVNQWTGTNGDVKVVLVDPATGASSSYPDVAGISTGALDDQRGQSLVYATDGVNDYGFLWVWMDKSNGTDYDIHAVKIYP